MNKLVFDNFVLKENLKETLQEIENYFKRKNLNDRNNEKQLCEKILNIKKKTISLLESSKNIKHKRKDLEIKKDLAKNLMFENEKMKTYLQSQETKKKLISPSSTPSDLRKIKENLKNDKENLYYNRELYKSTNVKLINQAAIIKELEDTVSILEEKYKVTKKEDILIGKGDTAELVNNDTELEHNLNLLVIKAEKETDEYHFELDKQINIIKELDSEVSVINRKLKDLTLKNESNLYKNILQRNSMLHESKKTLVNNSQVLLTENADMIKSYSSFTKNDSVLIEDTNKVVNLISLPVIKQGRRLRSVNFKSDDSRKPFSNFSFLK